MLLYFSATGNGKYLADRLCEREPQEQKSIPDCMRAGEFSFSDESSIGLIVPTYNFGPPSLVLEFLSSCKRWESGTGTGACGPACRHSWPT